MQRKPGLALLVILFLVTITTMCDTRAEDATNNITVLYNINIYDSISSMYSRTPAISGIMEIAFTRTDGSYKPLAMDLEVEKGGTLSILTSGALRKIISFPSIQHFSLSPRLLENARKERRTVTPEGWTLRYVSVSAVSLKHGMEEGYKYILVASGGSKEVVYDDDTGILLSELFYIKSSITGSIIVYINIAEGPSFLGDEGVPRKNLLVFEASSLLILAGSIYAVASKNRYRIL